MTAETRPAPPKETGPARGTPAKTSTSTANSTTTDDRSALPVRVTPLPLRWAKTLIDGATGPVPEYGSEEWDALPAHSREKVASTVIAAECWRTYTDPEEIAFRARIELDALRAEEDAPGQWTPETVDSVHRTARQPSRAALSHLRGEPEAEARANVHDRRLGLPVARPRTLRLVPDPVELPPAAALNRDAYDGGRVAWDAGGQ